MKARTLEDQDTSRGLIPAGTILDGEDAVRWIARGLAEAIHEDIERAALTTTTRKTARNP